MRFGTEAVVVVILTPSLPYWSQGEHEIDYIFLGQQDVEVKSNENEVGLFLLSSWSHRKLV
jgi:isopentenyldiphosphate isomerase